MVPKVSEVPFCVVNPEVPRWALRAQPCEKLRGRSSELQPKFLKAPDVFPSSLPASLFFSSLPLIHTLQCHLNTECALSRAEKTMQNKFPWIFICNNIWTTAACRSSCRIWASWEELEEQGTGRIRVWSTSSFFQKGAEAGRDKVAGAQESLDWKSTAVRTRYPSLCHAQHFSPLSLANIFNSLNPKSTWSFKAFFPSCVTPAWDMPISCERVNKLVTKGAWDRKKTKKWRCADRWKSMESQGDNIGQHVHQEARMTAREPPAAGLVSGV